LRRCAGKNQESPSCVSALKFRTCGGADYRSELDAGFPGGLGFQSMEFTILDNGVEILDLTFESLAVAESFFHDSVINLGSNLGPDIDLTFGYNLVADGTGGFGFDLAVGGAVPEPSTWAMMLVGFAGLGYAGYRRAGQTAADPVGASGDVRRLEIARRSRRQSDNGQGGDAQGEGKRRCVGRCRVVDHRPGDHDRPGRHGEYDNSRDKPCLMDQTALLSQSKSVGEFSTSAVPTPR
jgi:hypothetical protein